MNDQIKFIIGAVIFFALVWLLRCNVKDTTSTFTFQPFEGMANAQEVAGSFRVQTQQIADELKAELLAAKADKKSKEEMIAIADKFSDYSCQMSKAYSRWNINNAVV
jgi:nitrate/nitrite-specific signal transduction histidine kinase